MKPPLMSSFVENCTTNEKIIPVQALVCETVEEEEEDYLKKMNSSKEKLELFCLIKSSCQSAKIEIVRVDNLLGYCFKLE